jgi:hypothetical protein
MMTKHLHIRSAVRNAAHGVSLGQYACQVECEVEDFHGELNRYNGLNIDNTQVCTLQVAR